DGLEPARVAVAFGATFRVIAHDGEMLADLTGRLRHQDEGRRDLPAGGAWGARPRAGVTSPPSATGSRSSDRRSKAAVRRFRASFRGRACSRARWRARPRLSRSWPPTWTSRS